MNIKLQTNEQLSATVADGLAGVFINGVSLSASLDGKADLSALSGKADLSAVGYQLYDPGELSNYGLKDRAVNVCRCQSGTTLALPQTSPGSARDFLVRMILDDNGPAQFVNPAGEAVTFETEDGTFPQANLSGVYLWSFTETAPSVFAVSMKQLKGAVQ